MADERGVVKYDARDGSEVALSFETIKKFLVHGKPEFVTNQEMVFFMGICKARGLNPFAKDAYLMKYTDRDPAAIIVSIDYFRARAKAQPDCKGWKAGIVVMRNGEPVRSNGLMLDGDKLIGGWFTAKPNGWEETFELEVNLKPYIKTKQDGSPTRFWQPENQPTMIRKVAESQGLREVWPAEFAKLFVEEEVDAGAAMDMAMTGEKNGKASYEIKTAQPAGQSSEAESKEVPLVMPHEVLLEDIRKARPSSGKGAAENYRSLILGKIAVLKELPEVARNNARAKWDGANLGPWPLDPPPVSSPVEPEVVDGDMPKDVGMVEAQGATTITLCPERVGQKSGGTEQKPWTRTFFKHGENWYSTFNTDLGSMLLEASEAGRQVEISYSAGEKGMDIETVVFIGVTPPPPREPGSDDDIAF